MGLDMYLTRHIRIDNYDFDASSEILASAVLCALKIKNPNQYNNCSISIGLPAGYWRKANAIHKWFVENVQNGQDNCEPFSVDSTQLKELHSLCERVIADRSLAKKLLPPQDGFFFGDTNLDDWYFQELESTIEIIDDALNPENAVNNHNTFTYRASW